MLTRIPYDILFDIALQVALVDHGPPKHLIAFLTTCKSIYGPFNFDTCPLLYLNIFRAKFDLQAVARRLPHQCTDIHSVANQLKTYCIALRHIHNGEFNPETTEHALWNALCMMLENQGRNEIQLEWAGLKQFVDGIVRKHLWDSSEGSYGWPRETHLNALALWLMWFTTDEASLAEESADSRRQLMELVRPYVVQPVRYPIYHAPDCHMSFPITRQVAPTLQTPHGYYPPYRNPELLEVQVEHFGQKLSIGMPLITVAARLLYFSRSEATPYHIPDTLPVDREAAYEQNILQVMPTQQDYIRFNQHKAAAVASRGRFANSSKWDKDWERIRWCWNPHVTFPLRGSTYTYGSLEGEEYAQLPDADQYFATVTAARFEQHRPLMTTVPISMRLREYHAVSPTKVVATGRTQANPIDEVVMNAWLPHKAELFEKRGALRVVDQMGTHLSTYERWKEGLPNSHNSSQCMMCADERLRRIEEEGAARLGMKQRVTKKRKSASDSDEEDEPMDVSDSEDGDDRESRAFAKRPRTGRGPSARREDPGPAEDAQFEASGMEQVEEVEEIRRQWQQSTGSALQLDQVLEEETGGDDKACDGVQDVLFIGETLPMHGQAWHHYKFYGRMRSWDGFIAMVRVPRNIPELGTMIFRGYLVGNQNFVGNWRTFNQHANAIPLEGPFIASRLTDPE